MAMIITLTAGVVVAQQMPVRILNQEVQRIDSVRITTGCHMTVVTDTVDCVRVEVYADSPEFITGYVLRDDALEDLAEDHFDTKLGDIKRSLPYFNEDTSISDIFDAMLKQKSQIALVIDEYGCFQGIITLEDIIETIFGFEIIDENDVITDMQQYARERWQKRQKRIAKHVSVPNSTD